MNPQHEPTPHPTPLSRARDIYARAAKLPAVEITGADMHIGSQLTELEPFDQAFSLLSELVRDLRADGHEISHIDLGGGLGIPYREGDDPQSYHPERYAAIVRRHFDGLACKLVFEPGRLIVGNAGVLLTRVEYLKDNGTRHFALVDAGMNDLLRPALYEAWMSIEPVRPRTDTTPHCFDIVGPVCESADFLGKQRMLVLEPSDDERQRHQHHRRRPRQAAGAADQRGGVGHQRALAEGNGGAALAGRPEAQEAAPARRRPYPPTARPVHPPATP